MVMGDSQERMQKAMEDKGGRWEGHTASLSVALRIGPSGSQNFILIHLGGPKTLESM